MLTRPAATESGDARPSPFYEDARAVLDATEQEHGEELFGPAEGLQATYRMIQDEVLEEAWRAGGKLREPRLDTYVDVNRAVARFLELVKLAGLIQGSSEEPVSDSLAVVNDLLEQAISPEQRAALRDSGLDAYLLDEEGAAKRRRELIATARRALAGGLPAAARRGPGAVRHGHRALPDLPAEVQVRPGLRHPAGDDDQPAVRDRHPPGAGALPRPAVLAGRRPRTPAPDRAMRAASSG